MCYFRSPTRILRKLACLSAIEGTATLAASLLSGFIAGGLVVDPTSLWVIFYARKLRHNDRRPSFALPSVVTAHVLLIATGMVTQILAARRNVYLEAAFFSAGCVSLVSGTMAVLAFIEARRTSTKFAHPICASCGYDLRASGERCPECGSAIPPTAPTATATSQSETHTDLSAASDDLDGER